MAAPSPSLRQISKKVSFNSLSNVEDDPPREEKRLAILTSGGDSQGMNAALRAIVRIALYKGMKPYLVDEGYNGLVKGGHRIRKCQWADVSYILHKGGTVIGTARCREFREEEGRLTAARNLVTAGINNLVIIGGDGSLTGANLFKSEWPTLLEKLLAKNEITREQAQKYSYLNIIGLVGSIDNDMCGTDMTIGTDSALHRIVEAIDCVGSTAFSHQRSFVMEIMGRNCGYLTVMAGIAGGADWVFIPERPPEPGWEKSMCQKLKTCREQGRCLNFVLVAEGAIDQEGQKITPEYVRDVIQRELGYDTRITVLGHVQRGGKPSAYDRVLGSRMGAAASLALAKSEGEIPPLMIAIQGNEITTVPLMECVNRTRRIDMALKEARFEDVRNLRGQGFVNNIDILKRLEATSSPNKESQGQKYKFAVMNVGAPAGGTNNCTRSFVRLLLYQGHTVMGIHNAFEGCANGEFEEMNWLQVSSWGSVGGSNLGTSRTLPSKANFRKIAEHLERNKIQALLVIGGFEAFQSIIELEENRHTYPPFRIPILQIAATISNNVPGTEYSLGCDTALNVIVSACDVLKQSATASRKRVFVVESMGGYCGYLATAGALAGGADSAYIFEKPFKLPDLQRDVQHLVKKFRDGNVQRGLIIRNESCSVNYTTDFMAQMLAEEGENCFIARSIVLGHLQQGDRPSPFDRIIGAKYASHAVGNLLDQLEKCTSDEGVVLATSPETVCVLGLIGLKYETTPVRDLKSRSDMKYRIPNNQWWLQLYPLVRVLSHHTELDYGEEKHREKPPKVVETNLAKETYNIKWLPPVFVIGAAIALFAYSRYN